MKAKTNVRTDALTSHQNEAQMRAKAPGLKVKTNIKAGARKAHIRR